MAPGNLSASAPIHCVISPNLKHGVQDVNGVPEIARSSKILIAMMSDILIVGANRGRKCYLDLRPNCSMLSMGLALVEARLSSFETARVFARARNLVGMEYSHVTVASSPGDQYGCLFLSGRRRMHRVPSINRMPCRPLDVSVGRRKAKMTVVARIDFADI